jgi:predicted signal transduction protein with EAL and GGDEF domain
MIGNSLLNLSPSEILSYLPKSSIWIVVGVIVIFTLTYSIIFIYHWKKYGIGTTLLPYGTVLVYIVGTLFLLSIIVAAAITI